MSEASRQHWRQIILYGLNTATYKFAFGRALLEVAGSGHEFVTAEELAGPFSRYMVEHLQSVPVQTRSGSSRFLATCQHYLDGRVNEDELHAATIVHGFRYVIDAFPRLSNATGEDIPFYIDERSGSRPGLRLTDALLELAESGAADDLDAETEARWQLVERAWEAKRDDEPTLALTYESYDETLVPALLGKRRPWRLHVRPALNGYQRGHCFYCWRPVSVLAVGDAATHVDHLFPHVLTVRGLMIDLDQVWNLVLACRECNLQKRDALPDPRYIRRLHSRNEWLIGSQHPLRETVIKATGHTAQSRASFLRQLGEAAGARTTRSWTATPEGPSPFPSSASPGA